MKNKPPSLLAARGHRAADAPPGARRNALAAATALALVCLSGIPQARAQSIGELDVRSRLGERFFGAVPVRIDSGLLDPRCIRIAPNPNAPAGAEALPRARVRIGSADSVIIETADAVTSPIVGLRLEVGCENPVSRDFVVLGDLPDAARGDLAPAQPVAAAPTAAPAPRPARRAGPARTQTQAARSAGSPVGAPPPAPAASDPGTVAAAAPARSAAPAAAGLASENARRLSELQARSDDQAAALLALEDRLSLLQKQAELLKLQLEHAMAATPGAAQAGAAAPAAATPAAAAPAATDATSPSAPATRPAVDVAVQNAAATPTLAQPSPIREPGMLDLLLDWRVGGALAALFLGVVGFKMRRRQATARAAVRTNAQAPARPMTPLDPTYDPSVFEKTGEYPVMSSFNADKTTPWPNALQAPDAKRTAEWVAPPPATDNFPVPEPGMTDSQIRRANPAAMSREFHISQQFQPDAERVVALSSPEEIVQQARTHYMDDGDTFRAIDLLEMAVSVRKDSPRPWQALFAIYRRERMPERFQRLVLAYRSAFGEDDNWGAIQALGRELDPDNRLYAAGPASETLPDDLLERWLGVPLDFTAHLLANEMHDQLMSTNPGRKRRRNSGQ